MRELMYNQKPAATSLYHSITLTCLLYGTWRHQFMFISAQALHPYRLAQRCMRGTVDTRQNNMIVLLYVSFVERSKTCECNHNWAGELAPRHVSKPNQQWWMNVILLCISSYSLSIYSPAMHSFKYPSFALHKSLFIPPSTFLSSDVSLISFCWLLLPSFFFVALPILSVHVHVKFDGAGIQTDLPGRGVHQWPGVIHCNNRVSISGSIKVPKP